MKKITNLNDKMLTLAEEEHNHQLPTLRAVLQSIGNQKAETADDARKTRRILIKMRDQSVDDLVLENEDVAFLEKLMEKNDMNLPAWMQGQVLEAIANAEKVEPMKVV